MLIDKPADIPEKTGSPKVADWRKGSRGQKWRTQPCGALRFNPRQIEHEDELVSQRVIRQILTQAFFFGANASLLNAPIEAKNSLFETEQILHLWLMPTAALLAGLLTYVGIVSSLKTIVHVRQLYDDHLKSKAPAIPQAGYIHISRVSRTFENWRYSHLQCCQ